MYEYEPIMSKPIDPDIQGILKEIESKFSSPNITKYKCQPSEQTNHVSSAVLKGIKDLQGSLVRSAELFYTITKELVPGVRVNQLRIGHDACYNIPVVLMIIDAASEHYIEHIMTIARRLEDYIYQTNNSEVCIWTLIDNNCLEKNLICVEFPLYREVE